MIRIQIKDENLNIKNEGVFQTEELADQWYEFNYDFFPNPHTKHVTSMADEIAQEKRIKESKDAIELGTNLIVEIRAINRRKLKTGLWDQAKFNSLLVNSTAAQIERALWNGSLTTAGYLLTGMSAFYSDLEIEKIVEQINAHEAKWSELI